MPNHLKPILLNFFAFSFLLPSPTFGLSLGSAIPSAEKKLKNVDNRTSSLKELSGEKGTLVIFSCNTCPWAVAWEDRIVAIGNEYRGKGVGVAVINSNDPGRVEEDSLSNMKKRAKEKGFQFPYLSDPSSEMAKAFGATRTPEVYLFDQQRKLVYWGAVDDNAKEPSQVKTPFLRMALEALLKGKPIAPAETKAIGCTIKSKN